jgi:ribosomal protein S12 methylthiotransferase accessory factor
LERYSALTAVIPLERATLRESGLLGRLPVCAPDEPCDLSFRSPREDVPLTQTPARRLASGEDVLVPAALVSLAFNPAPPEPPVAIPISTGLAFHPELHQAIWRGLCEVVERDAVMTLWWLHRPVPEISLAGDAIPHSIVDRIDRLEACGFNARLYDITTEVEIPTIFCVLSGERFPKLVVSAATRADPAEACAKALDEVVSMRVALQATSDGSREPDGAPVGLVDHACLYARDANDAAFDFLLRDEHPVLPYSFFAERELAVPSSLDALAELARALAEDDLSVLWADVTSPDVAEFGVVVRTIVPELVPLSPDDHVRWLGTPRLLRRAGFETATRSAFASYPHPFA